MTDHNEAMRLADALAQPGVRYATETEAQAKLRRIKNQAEAAALIRKQAERIAELELQPAFAQLASDLAVKLADTEAERDTLRAEVERQTSALKVIYTWAGIPGALKPESVRELSGKALGKATQ